MCDRKWRRCCLLAAMAWALGAAGGAHGAGRESIAPGGEGEYIRYVLTLERALDGCEDMILTCSRFGNRLPQAWLTTMGKPYLPRSVRASNLAVEDGRLTGSVTAPGMLMRITLDAAVSEDGIRGTYKWVTFPNMRDETVVAEGAGALIGAIVREADLRKRLSFAKGKDWPCLRGPYGNGSAVPCERDLIDQWHDIRLTWKSEGRMPNSHAYGGPEGTITLTQGGYAGPVVVDGRVYCRWWEPSGDVVDEAILARLMQYGCGLATYPALDSA